MTVYLMLTLDLNGNVSTEAREKFYNVLKADHLKRRKLTTTWSAHFVSHYTVAMAETHIKELLKRASTVSGVRNYEAAYMFSTSPMVEQASPAYGLLGAASLYR